MEIGLRAWISPSKPWGQRWEDHLNSLLVPSSKTTAPVQRPRPLPGGEGGPGAAAAHGRERRDAVVRGREDGPPGDRHGPPEGAGGHRAARGRGRLGHAAAGGRAQGPRRAAGAAAGQQGGRGEGQREGERKTEERRLKTGLKVNMNESTCNIYQHIYVLLYNTYCFKIYNKDKL